MPAALCAARDNRGQFTQPPEQPMMNPLCRHVCCSHFASAAMAGCISRRATAERNRRSSKAACRSAVAHARGARQSCCQPRGNSLRRVLAGSGTHSRATRRDNGATGCHESQLSALLAAGVLQVSCKYAEPKAASSCSASRLRPAASTRYQSNVHNAALLSQQAGRCDTCVTA